MRGDVFVVKRLPAIIERVYTLRQQSLHLSDVLGDAIISKAGGELVYLFCTDCGGESQKLTVQRRFSGFFY